MTNFRRELIKQMKETLNEEAVTLTTFDKVVIMGQLFDLASMVAKMSIRLENASLISDEEENNILTNMCSAQSIVAMILECEKEHIDMAAQFSQCMPDEVLKNMDVKSRKESIIDFSNEAKAWI